MALKLHQQQDCREKDNTALDHSRSAAQWRAGALWSAAAGTRAELRVPGVHYKPERWHAQPRQDQAKN